MSERLTVHLNDLMIDPESAGHVVPDGSFPIIHRDDRFVCVQGRTIVTNGCFDVLHPGHLSLLASLDTIAYQMRLRPIVAMNSDHSIRRLKGDHRPIVPEEARSALLNSLKWPFTVILFDEETPQRLMDLLQPVAVLKGSEYPAENVIRWRGSQVVSVEMVPGWSTSGIIGDTR